MKTNQIFNFSRFGRYAKSSLIINYRQLLIFWGGMISAIFLLYLFITVSMNNDTRVEAMTQPFLIFFFAGGVIFAGNSFPAFRKKEKTIAMLTTPASAMERFAYEFLEKIVAFIILYPPTYYLASNSAIFIRNALSWRQPEFNEYTINGVVSKIQVFPYQYFSLNRVVNNFPEGELLILFSIAFLLFSIAFASAATFRKFPLAKTAVFCGALVATVAGYVFFIKIKLRLQHLWIESIGDIWEKENIIAFACSILIFLALIMLTYSYFKVKEKEAQ